MPVPAETPDDAQNRWDQVFRDPKVIAGVTAAQHLVDAELLHRLDAQLTEPRCDVSNCDFEAVLVAYWRRPEWVKMIGLFCGAHRHTVGAHWRHAHGVALLWRPIFSRPVLR
jgi:hypothetical protein